MKLICFLFGCCRVGKEQSLVTENHIKTTYYLAPFCKRCGKVLIKTDPKPEAIKGDGDE